VDSAGARQDVLEFQYSASTEYTLSALQYATLLLCKCNRRKMPNIIDKIKKTIRFVLQSATEPIPGPFRAIDEKVK
jgi:hypothetical protein